MKFKAQIPFKHFIFSQILILFTGLIFLSGLYYILNIQYASTDRPFLNGPVTTSPKSLRLDLDQPEDDNLTFDESILVSGKTGPDSEILIYTDTQDLVIKSKQDGSFSTTLNLDEGVNRLTVAVFDEKGDVRSSERTVYYSKEKI